MSDVLRRLVDRAQGTAQGGLRPRRPAMFETGGQAPGIRETLAEEPVGPVRPAPSQHAPHMRPAAANRVADPDHPAANRPARAERAAPPAPLAAAHREVHTVETAERAVPTALSPPPDAAMPPPPILADAPGAPPSPVRPGGEPATPERAPFAPELRMPEPLAAPPSPLLALMAVAGRPVVPGPTDARVAPMAAHVGTEAASGPPEITIHIGRLDIRTDPPRPQRPTVRAPAMPALSDYLRDGGS